MTPADVKLQLKIDISEAVRDAQRFLTDEELCQELEVILRTWFSARVNLKPLTFFDPHKKNV